MRSGEHQAVICGGREHWSAGELLGLGEKLPHPDVIAGGSVKAIAVQRAGDSLVTERHRVLQTAAWRNNVS